MPHLLSCTSHVHGIPYSEVLQPKQSVELWKTMFQSLLIWGTYIWGVLLFEWVLIFEKSVASVSMGTCICGVLVFDGYLYSREYGIHMYH